MRIVGEIQTLPLEGLTPNSWNPNRMPAHVMTSLRYGLKQDGWIAAQAMVVWGRDEKGTQKDIIIDGEHRWRCALDIGMSEAPVTVIDGLTEQEAKNLTIKLNQKRGTWDTDALAALVQSLTIEDVSFAALDLGLEAVELLDLIDADLSEVISSVAGLGSSLLVEELDDPSGYDDSPIKEIDLSAKAVDFWISIRGPAIAQPEVLNRLVDTLGSIDNIRVDVGLVGDRHAKQS